MTDIRATSMVPITQPIAVIQRQRFPESCQRTSIDDPESEETALRDDFLLLTQESSGPFQRESSPSSRFYERHRGRRPASWVPEPSYIPEYTEAGPSSYSPHRRDFLPVSRFDHEPQAHRSRVSTPDSHDDLPVLSDSEMSSGASSSSASEGPHSPVTPWFGPECSISMEPLDALERLPSPAHIRLASDSSDHGLPSSESSTTRSASAQSTVSCDSISTDVGLDQHSTFSKVVVTKFSNPSRYRLKKVKFHECPICQKSFPRPSGLRTHMNMHTNTKPYACPYEGCDKSFSVISNAKRHYRTHLVDLSPDQIGLPAGPYTVNFSDPVVVPDSPPHEAYYSSLPPLSSSSSSLSSLASNASDYSPGTAPGDAQGRPLRSARDGSASVTGRRRTARPRTLRWLPLGADSRSSGRVVDRQASY